MALPRAVLEANLDPSRAVAVAPADESPGHENASAAGAEPNGASNGAAAQNGHAHGHADADATARGAVGRFLLDEMGSYGVVAAGDQLHGLLAETRAVLASAAYRLTVADLLAASVDTLVGELQLLMEGGEATPPASRALPLAKVLPQLNNLAKTTLYADEPCLAAVLSVPSLDELSWMAYSDE